MANLLGSNKGADIARQQAEQQQRRSLATLASQQAEIDQASSMGSRKRGAVGRGLLTFLSGTGQSTFG